MDLSEKIELIIKTMGPIRSKEVTRVMGYCSYNPEVSEILWSFIEQDKVRVNWNCEIEWRTYEN